MERRAVIVGGGIGGLAAASALRRVGISAEVFERAPEIREVGAGFTIWANALKSLERIGVAESALQLGAEIRRIRTFSPDGRELSLEDIESVSERAGAPSICIHRADLQRALAEQLERNWIHTGKECVGFRRTHSSVTVRFSDGTEERGDLLIGADGLHSVVRESLFGKREPRYAGYYCYRGLAHTEDMPEDEALFSMVPGAQIGFFPIGRPGVTYWFVCPNAPYGRSRDSSTDHQAVLERLCRYLPEKLAGIILDPDQPAPIVGDVFDRRPIDVWGDGSVTLLGDAAHPMTPNLGQGACMAIEDAIVLADAVRSSDDVHSGLRRYVALRRKRTASIVRASDRVGRIYQLENALLVRLRTAGMRLPPVRWAGRKFQESLLRFEPPTL